MELAGDDLQDDLIIDESIASSEEDESSHFIPEISQDNENRAGSSSNAANSVSLLAKKRKRKAKEKERKAKVRLWREFRSLNFYTDRLWM